jgi:hypothetical protein
MITDENQFSSPRDSVKRKFLSFSNPSDQTINRRYRSMTIHAKKWALWAGLSLCSAVIASANTVVTFQVDMSVEVANAAFDPATQTVAVHGSFNNWAAFPLTNNPSGANPHLWTGTTDLPTNGIVVSYKYTIEPGATYELVAAAGGHNRLITLPSTSGASLVVTKAYYGDTAPDPNTTSIPVTFQVNMAQQINTGAFDKNSSSVYVRGWFNNYSQDIGMEMTNDPSILITNQFGLVTSNVYVMTYTLDSVTGSYLYSPGETIDYKFYVANGHGIDWESPAPGVGDPADNNNRFFNLSDGTPQTLPIIYFNDDPYAPVANVAVTFQVDMTAQVIAGNFDPAPGAGTVEVRGSFNGWGAPETQILCTNDLAAANTNLYSVVVPLTGGVGSTVQYKFWASVSANGGWETMTDRFFKLGSGTSQILPVVFFSNIDPADLLSVDAVVTFRVSMTNAVGTDSHAFDPAVDQVFINGVPNGFATWDTSLLPQLTNNPVGSKIYSTELTLPKGSPVQQTYKFGINGADNEAASGANHIRIVRTASAYTMPLDTFGNQLVEPSFGQLAAGPVSAGQVSVSWLGRPGVHLQTAADLTSGTWQDLLNTDGAGWASGYTSPNGFVSVTNYPTIAEKTFFRLIKK